ncbi:hypothetical protein RMA95_15820 [Acinetobacter sp. V110_1]|uniref:hypothetical protein n=1 Tax=Acinetobacter sp. V110_1 TaxID=3072988 RepID=UPI00287C8AAE|nr:hypothetical protein [Acinetobacter sp. V110_1]MDS7945378.1 hypothetical protein [Acinetobacter sp. V110_1]
MKKLTLLGIIILSLVRCITAEIVPIGADTYMISQTSAGVIFRSMSSLKTGVINRATEYASSQNKIAVPIAEIVTCCFLRYAKIILNISY